MVQEGGQPAIGGLVGIALSCRRRDPSPGAARPSPGPGRLRRAWGKPEAAVGVGWGTAPPSIPGWKTAVTPLKSGRGLQWGPAGTAVPSTPQPKRRRRRRRSVTRPQETRRSNT